MRGGLRFKISVGIVAAAVSLAAAAAVLADTSNLDPTGDAKGGAPDITRVVTFNDAAGTITFRVTMVAPIIDTSNLGISLNTDSNPGTGAAGVEYILIADTGGFGIGKWNGSRFAAVKAPSLTMTRSANVVVFRINRSDLGNVNRLGFAASTANFDAADAFIGGDDAPDGGEYIYTLSLPQCANGKDDDGDGRIDGKDLGCATRTDNRESGDPVTLQAGKARVVPAKPQAGKAAVVSAAVIRKETGRPITSGTVRCAVRVGTRAVRASGEVGAGGAACRFTLPESSNGTTVRGTITVSVEGHSIRVPFSFSVS